MIRDKRFLEFLRKALRSKGNIVIYWCRNCGDENIQAEDNGDWLDHDPRIDSFPSGL